MFLGEQILLKAKHWYMHVYIYIIYVFLQICNYYFLSSTNKQNVINELKLSFNIKSNNLTIVGSYLNIHVTFKHITM